MTCKYEKLLRGGARSSLTSMSAQLVGFMSE